MSIHICKKCGQDFKQINHYRRHINKNMCFHYTKEQKNNTLNFRENKNISNLKEKNNTSNLRNKLIKNLKEKMDKINANDLELYSIQFVLIPRNKSKSKIMVIEK